MKIISFLKNFIKTFLITLIVSIGVTYFWNLLMNNSGSIDWEVAFRFALILGIVTNLTDIGKNKWFFQ